MKAALKAMSTGKQVAASCTAVLATTGVCYVLSGTLGYRSVAFILLLMVSLIAVVFDITAVLIAATLSAISWNFLFIPPRFTFHIRSADDSFLFLVYFLIAIVSAVLTNRIRKTEKQVREKEEKERTVKLYNTLLNSLSHELKTPIATIIAASDNLLDNSAAFNTGSRKELIENISVASLRLNQQVENLLSMSRLESGFVKLKRDWTDLNELTYEVLDRLEQPLKDHHVHIDIPENLPFYKLDYGLMEQVLHNLLYNASLYAPAYTDIFITIRNGSEKMVEMDADTREQSGVKRESGWLLIMIEDRGPGFPPAEMQQAFDKFYRVHDTQTGGTGLGLSIVKGFVEAHDGRVELENVPHGARFTIRIPAETSYISNLKNE